MDAVVGYKAAMRELEDRYGDSEGIANAYIKKALDRPLIKGDDAKGLEEFSFFLVECEHAVSSIEALKVLKYSENMKRLISKLPYYLHDRWRSMIMESKRENRVVSFHHLVNLVRDEAKKANHPLYGKDAISLDQKRKRDLAQSKGPTVKHMYGTRAKESFAACETDVKAHSEVTSSTQHTPTETKSVTTQDVKSKGGKTYLYCNCQTHGLEKCDRIGELPPKERFDFMKSKGLCFG